jgi:gliding motility-associated transport system permease protein
MSNVYYIMSKELRSYFVSPVAYIVVAFWLVGTGFFFTLAVTQSQQANMSNVFGVVTILLLLIAPALTMRLLSEESRTGTLELLLTAPVKDWAVVLGKFLAALVLYAVMIGLMLFYPVLLVVFRGNPDWGPIWSGFLGLLLFGMVFLAVGLFASALTSNQIVSAVIAFILLLLLYIISNASGLVSSNLSDFVNQLSVSNHFDPFSRGIIDLKDVIYFVSFAALVLFLTVEVVEARRYRS